MTTLVKPSLCWQLRWGFLLAFCATLAVYSADGAFAADKPVALPVPDSTAEKPADMKAYTDVIPNTEIKFPMAPIPGGTFFMGSTDAEAGHKPDESPQHSTVVEPFWMEAHEVTWDEFEVFMFTLDIERRKNLNVPANENDKFADALARPTKPYTDMTFGMGKDGYPAIAMTHYAARMYCKWLSTKTGRYYRLPTEAEWEYACRAGTSTAYSFGDDAAKLKDYGWFFDNSDGHYSKVGKKKPNPWGLYDMHGNATEWVLDQYVADFYEQFKNTTEPANTFAPTKSMYPHAVRGGSWDDDAESLRSAARRGSNKDWKQQDPQLPQSVWYLTDAQFVGFRIIRPFREPSEEEKQRVWDAGLEAESEGARVVYPMEGVKK
jgi:formylglycine-generating enzyme required for sulfatase activity